MKAPQATKKPHKLAYHNHTLIDNYYWLREKDNPQVIEHLKAENEYCRQMTEGTADLRKLLFDEMKQRIREEDESVPIRKGNNYYYSKSVKNKQYREYYRKKGNIDATPELLLDCNKLAEGYEYFSLGEFVLSPNERYLAYATDTDGGEEYVLKIKDMETGELLADTMENVTSVDWATNNKTIFYSINNDSWRSYKVMRHDLGGTAPDVEVYTEEDERYSVEVELSKDEKYLFISTSSQITTECLFIPANKPYNDFVIFAARRQGIEYYPGSHNGKFFIRTNDNAVNFKIVTTPENATEFNNWADFIPNSKDISLEDFDEFKDYLVILLRENGLHKIKILNLIDGTEEYIDFPDPSYTLTDDSNLDFDDTVMRYCYSSLSMPSTVYEYDMKNKTKKVLKRVDPATPYNHQDYTTERLFAEAADGVKIPISIVYKNDFKQDGTMPLLLYAYGSYGIPVDAAFGFNRISLLDRGFAYAIAHVRGGSEMGEQWYLNGKLMNKKNTFTDFIACAQMLVDKKYTSPQHLAINGGSAGGLLMGAVVNMRPDLFKVVFADVPFVDVMNTMCDASLPLTVGEYEEWGNPLDDAESFQYMSSYSPYDNIKNQSYPHIYATAGINDPRVSYWEPAKWVLKLRNYNTSENLILLRTNMDAGHGGASGRYDYLKEVAEDYAFIINCIQNDK